MPRTLQEALTEELGRIVKDVLPNTKIKSRRKRIRQLMYQATSAMHYSHVEEMVESYKKLIDLS